MIINRKLVLVSVAAIVILVSVFFALAKAHVFESSKTKQQKQTAQQDHQQKEAAIAGNGNPGSTDSQGKTSSNPSTYSPPKDTANITVNATQKDSSRVVVSTELVGYSDGSCELTVTNGTSHTSQTAQVIYAPNFSTCAGFTVPVSSLGAGTWNISLAVTSGGITNTKSLNVGVR